MQPLKHTGTQLAVSTCTLVGVRREELCMEHVTGTVWVLQCIAGKEHPSLMPSRRNIQVIGHIAPVALRGKCVGLAVGLADLAENNPVVLIMHSFNHLQHADGSTSQQLLSFSVKREVSHLDKIQRLDSNTVEFKNTLAVSISRHPAKFMQPSTQKLFLNLEGQERQLSTQNESSAAGTHSI